MDLWDDSENDVNVSNKDWRGPEALALLGLVCLGAILMFILIGMIT